MVSPFLKSSIRNLYIIQSHKYALIFPLRNLIILAFTFWPIINLQVIFVGGVRLGLRFFSNRDLIVLAPFVEKQTK